MSTISTRSLSIQDAHALAPLVAACVQERHRGAPPPPDQFYAERLLNDRTAELVGAFADGGLKGFAVFFDLPDLMNGRRTGQLNELFVLQDSRGQGIERRLVEAVAEEAGKRDWAAIHWLVPDKPEVARELAERFGRPAGWSVFALP